MGFLGVVIEKVSSAIGKITTRLRAWISGGKQLNTESPQKEYFTIATHYYIAARYAFFSGLIPTAGNLFHHAIEMYLKGYLSPHLGESKRKNLGHSLKRIWRAFKRSVKDPALDEYDTAIKLLDRFESIRYPEKSVREGFEVHFSLVTPNPPSSGPYAMPASQRYDVVLHQIDNLVATIFQKSGLNPSFFLTGLNNDARAFLVKDNPTALWGP